MNTYQLQCLLAYLGYMEEKKNGGTVRWPIDGLTGPQTRQATAAFQKVYGLPVTGEADSKTQKALKDSVAYDKFKPPDTEEPTEAGPDSGPDWWKDIRYFKRSEPYIGCSCGKCGGFPAEPTEKLMRLADRVRDHFGEEMIPTSTVRCQAHNDAQKNAAKNSRHLTGRAMDYWIVGHSSAEVLAWVKQQPEVNYAYAVSNQVVHMDVD